MKFRKILNYFRYKKSFTPRTPIIDISAENFFDKKIKDVKELSLDNQSLLRSVNCWYDLDAINASIFNYGLRSDLNVHNHVTNNLTYTELLLYLSELITEDVNYLELGISLGKNFICINKYLTDSNLTGIDIEKMNPVLESFFGNKERVNSWPPSKSIKNIGIQNDSLVTNKISYYEEQYIDENQNNNIRYIRSNIYEDYCWSLLSKEKFNIILMDATHEKNELVEWDMIKKYNLIDSGEFIFILDDINLMGNQFSRVVMELENLLLETPQRSFTMTLDSYYRDSDIHKIGVVLGGQHILGKIDLFSED